MWHIESPLNSPYRYVYLFSCFVLILDSIVQKELRNFNNLVSQGGSIKVWRSMVVEWADGRHGLTDQR